MKTYKALVALDWADKKHDGVLLKRGSKEFESFRLAHSPEHIDEWVIKLNRRFGKGRFAVILEQSNGALFSALCKYDCFELYPVNPVCVSEYRKSFVPSGAKSDSVDAELMLDYLQRHGDKLKKWMPEDEQTRTLGILVEQRRVLVNERKRQGNRLTDLLKRYYPQVLKLFPKMGTVILCEFVLRYPSLGHAKEASREELIKFFKSHRSGNTRKLEQRLEYLEKTLPLTEDQAIITTSMLMAESLCRQILALIKSIDSYEKQIEAAYAAHQDATLFSSLPATGETMAPRLLSAFGSDRERFSSASEMQRYLGIAPVVVESGNKRWIRWRYNCAKFKRQSIHEWAGITIKHSLWARAFYAMQRAKGKSHPVAVRALAYKWIRIIYKLWKENKLYNEASYIAALQRNGSPIIKFLAENPDLEKLKFSNS